MASFISSQSFSNRLLPTRKDCCFDRKTSYRKCTRQPIVRREISTGPTMLFGLFRKEKQTVYDIDELSLKYPAIRVENLRKTFRKKFAGVKRKKETRFITAIEDLSFTVDRGTIFALLGPNSCGKSTTMRCMGTITSPDSGIIEYYGVDAVKNDLVARNMIGYVMQSAGLDKTLTGREHLNLFAGLAHVDRDIRQNVIDTIIDLLQLDEFIDRLAGVYSGGIARRMDLAIALLHQPPILILDEPTVGLDIESRQIIWQTLRHWRDNGGTVLFSSHYLEEVDILSDRVAIMDRGVLIANGTPMELKSNLGGDRISVRLDEFTPSDSAERAFLELRQRGLVFDGVVNTLKNNSLELVVDADDASVGGRIVQALKEIGHGTLFSFAQSKPSLDDVYLAATGQSITDADILAKSARSERSIRKENMT